MKRTIRLGAALAALVLATATAAAATKKPSPPATPKFDDAQQYNACMTQARSKPDQGLETALAWQSRGGAEAAEHCAAVALIGLGESSEAATRLEKLGQKLAPGRPGLAAEILAQSGQAWLMAGKPDRAYAVQTTALKLAPRDVDLLVDRAVTLGQAKNYWEAIDDLNRAHELAPKRADILVFRASAYRFVDSPDLALEDLDAAIALDPRNPEAYLERGILRRLANDREGARSDWLKTLSLSGTTPTGEAARKNLELLDLKAK
jgi:tetratricopeptide (TPR) repeat protein